MAHTMATDKEEEMAEVFVNSQVLVKMPERKKNRFLTILFNNLIYFIYFLWSVKSLLSVLLVHQN